jgi:hypothetical protein
MFRRFMILGAVLVSACSPTLDWREVRPEGSGAQVLFPCKPRHETRQVVLAGGPVQMTLYACKAAGAIWAFGFADLRDPDRVAPALVELGAAAKRNVVAAPAASQPFSAPGMTPNGQSQRLILGGSKPDGTAVQSHVALFSKGTRVFQANVVGARPVADAVETFFSALRVTS